ncbi:MAG: TrkA family potassium uptake protein, partial [Myxococcota bacterium]
QHSEREWTKVKASTYRDHVVLCGVGHLGFRVLQELVTGEVSVVAIEKNPDARFLGQARVMGIPVLVRDMKDDEALREAGVEHARAIVVATNDDMANLEVVLDARRMNPRIRILMRLFDQQIAAKISQPLSVDVAFSASALAAPIVAAMTLGARVLASFAVAGVPHVTAEVTADGKLGGRGLAELEQRHGVRVLARGRPGEMRDTAVAGAEPVVAGEVLVVYGSAARVGSMAGESSA